jgi:hypothetical protein
LRFVLLVGWKDGRFVQLFRLSTNEWTVNVSVALPPNIIYPSGATNSFNEKLPGQLSETECHDPSRASGSSDDHATILNIQS